MMPPVVKRLLVPAILVHPFAVAQPYAFLALKLAGYPLQAIQSPAAGPTTMQPYADEVRQGPMDWYKDHRPLSHLLGVIKDLGSQYSTVDGPLRTHNLWTEGLTNLHAYKCD